MTNTPPVFTPRRHNYRDVLTDIQDAAGEWIEINQSRIAGATIAARQSALTAAGRRNRILVETGTNAGEMYARLKPQD